MAGHGYRKRTNENHGYEKKKIKMVKAKEQKPKPNTPAKQPQNKKRGGKQSDLTDFRDQLDTLGLKIIQVTADGNCFFRALADQLDGNEDEYEKYRDMVVEYIQNHREDFEPFVEDEVPFDEYCQSMAEDGTWAGHMELQAASVVTQSNICIHRHMSPRWYIQNFDKEEARMVHLSYHDGEHYNSVRSKEDSCAGPARPIIIPGDADISATSNQTNTTTVKSGRKGRRSVVKEESIKLVKAGSRCKDDIKVEQVLQDVNTAAESFIAAQVSIDEIVTEKNSNDGKQDVVAQQDKIAEQNTEKQDFSDDEKLITYIRRNSRTDEKKFSQDKTCPCGSKKKYKSCCGAVAGKSSARFPVNQTVDFGKSKKEQKQGRKGGSTTVNSIQTEGRAP